MNRSYRQQILTLFSLACLVVLAGNVTGVAAQGKRARASTAAAISPESVVFTEDFNYTAGGLLTANGWTAHSGGGTNAQTVTTPGLTYAGYAGSGVGNAATITASGEDVNRSFSSPATSGTVYVAFLVNVSSATALGDYFFHLYSTSTVFRGKVFVKKHATENTFAFGISKNANFDTVSAYTAADYQPGTTYLLVLKYVFVSGDTNDTVSLFVNPVPGAAEPAATLTAGDNTATDVANFPGVGIRQGTNSPALTVDAIRVATTWEEAVAAGGSAVVPDGIVDIDGDGKTDYLIVRPEGGAAAAATIVSDGSGKRSRLSTRERLKMRAEALQNGDNLLAGGGTPLRWWGLNSTNFSVSTAEWGSFPGDEPLTADFDGDGRDDFTVFRPDVTGSYWYSLDSSTFTVRQVHFGGPADNPFVVGDYDGDKIDDPAVFRCPSVNAGTCYFYYRPSSIPNSGDWAVAWGTGISGDVRPFPGDFNGDGKMDFAVNQQSPTTPGNGVFYIALNGTFEFSAVEWGRWLDYLIPGDFDGDGKSDFTVTQLDQNSVLWWYTLEQDGGMRFVPWGGGPDIEVPGDYDGDGKDDIAIYRDNATDATYWVLPSSGASHFAVTWGQPFDIPIQNVFVQ